MISASRSTSYPTATEINLRKYVLLVGLVSLPITLVMGYPHYAELIFVAVTYVGLTAGRTEQGQFLEAQFWCIISVGFGGGTLALFPYNYFGMAMLSGLLIFFGRLFIAYQRDIKEHA